MAAVPTKDVVEFTDTAGTVDPMKPVPLLVVPGYIPYNPPLRSQAQQPSLEAPHLYIAHKPKQTTSQNNIADVVPLYGDLMQQDALPLPPTPAARSPAQLQSQSRNLAIDREPTPIQREESLPLPPVPPRPPKRQQPQDVNLTEKVEACLLPLGSQDVSPQLSPERRNEQEEDLPLPPLPQKDTAPLPTLPKEDSLPLPPLPVTDGDSLSILPTPSTHTTTQPQQPRYGDLPPLDVSRGSALPAVAQNVSPLLSPRPIRKLDDTLPLPPLPQEDPLPLPPVQYGNPLTLPLVPHEDPLPLPPPPVTSSVKSPPSIKPRLGKVAPLPESESSMEGLAAEKSIAESQSEVSQPQPQAQTQPQPQPEQVFVRLPMPLPNSGQAAPPVNPDTVTVLASDLYESLEFSPRLQRLAPPRPKPTPRQLASTATSVSAPALPISPLNSSELDQLIATVAELKADLDNTRDDKPADSSTLNKVSSTSSSNAYVELARKAVVPSLRRHTFLQRAWPVALGPIAVRCSLCGDVLQAEFVQCTGCGLCLHSNCTAGLGFDCPRWDLDLHGHGPGRFHSLRESCRMPIATCSIFSCFLC